MWIANDGFPIILVLLLVIVILLWYKFFGVAAVVFLLLLSVCLFFRDPARDLPTDPNALFSPADGKVLEINRVKFNNEDYYQVVIFLSVFNVHINRIPFAGKVISLKYIPGYFFAADKVDRSDTNERMEIVLATKQGQIKVVQIAGLIARKIVCRLKEDQVVKAGEKFGMIKFGSRTDLYFPVNTEILVKTGSKVQAGITKIATF